MTQATAARFLVTTFYSGFATAFLAAKPHSETPLEIKRFDRDGKYWVRLRESDADYCVDVAVTQSGQVSLNYLAAAMRIADDCGHGHDPTSRYVHRGRQAV
ncbi:MAG: hypothetical protein WBE15_08795 [Candidatus Cybelea sp.]